MKQMKRAEFTDKITALIRMMIEEGELPIIDFVKRSNEEQRRLFEGRLSKCDGYKKISMHQLGKAADIYFLNEKQTHIVEPNLGYNHWHAKWCEMGGKPAIDWDKNHFE